MAGGGGSLRDQRDRRLADGLKRDLAAVTEAMRSPWSKRPSGRDVNRLKLIKRQMYGRAKFDLLKARVLYAT